MIPAGFYSEWGACATPLLELGSKFLGVEGEVISEVKLGAELKSAPEVGGFCRKSVSYVSPYKI